MWNRAAVFMCAGASQRGLGSEPMLMVRLSSMLGTMAGMDVEWEPLELSAGRPSRDLVSSETATRSRAAGMDWR